MKRLDKNEALELGSPYPYVLAVTQDGEGKNNIIGIGWWTYVSWDPLMLCICIGTGKKSHENLEEVPEFTLCFPAKDQAKGAWLCGTKSGSKVEKFPAAGFTPAACKEIKPPMIEGSTLVDECRVTDKVDAGDHTIFVAEVLSMQGDPEKAEHLYSIHYRKLVSIDTEGKTDFDLEH